ncbi:FAD-dependent oxidoreductase [Aerococcus sp. YH-aer221]|uniref:FAD-dependent oxidoreductase n=2 Tax=Aerococcus kribbianus TaxID=2999064 RepID=A0A9X3FUV2_9LACT|nr:FAD-dependent oxidoreductase [Aerococcus sp. YH-aer221]MCZ0725644.1 FAD-dependent oxidoreductase [Aerococcus sp. YH-aer222]
MKFVVVGTSHYGYEATQTLLKDYPDAEIHLYERGDKASFLSCGIQSYLEDIAPSLDSLHYANEDSYQKQGVNIHVNADVVALDPEAKEITVETADGQEKQSYDKLFLSPGAVPAPLPVPGTDLEEVYYMRGPVWAEKIKTRMQTAKKVVVVGAGYIGFEAAESFAKQGIDTTLIEFKDHILPTYLDKEITNVLEANAQEHGLKLQMGEGVSEIVGEEGKVSKVKTDKGEYEADTVIIALGVKPNTEWLQGSIDLDDRGFVKIDKFTHTSAEDVFAGGDATFIPYGPDHEEKSIALATNARKQAVVSVKNAFEDKLEEPELNGTSALPVFDYTIATTGVNETTAGSLNAASHYYEEKLLPDFRGQEETVHMKITYDKDSHKILGGQLASKANITHAINALSVAITAEWTLEQLALADFFFQPGFDRPWHFLNVLAQQALGETFGSDQMIF